ncbi:MAG: YihY/virulence factor BrkB family protein, partial [Leptotrichiaceae bacterium]|nr:YihY/virulence factor BrkB family protein [Leptotrichiaceae bacterium]
VLAISLTYFSLLALFPLMALILGITKGFGLDIFFISKLFELVPQNEEMIRTVLDIANKLLKSAESGVLAGVGIVILLNSVIKVLITLEDSFNKIWHVSKKRSITRRIVDCIAIIFIGPIFLIVLIGTNSFVIEQVSTLFFRGTVGVGIFTQILGPLFYILLFTLIFYLIPNTNIKLKSAIISGIITSFLCYILKFIFLSVQGSITSYNAIYGSLALVPIFLIWVQYIWVTILLGSQISFCIQSSDEFLYDERVEIPIKYRKELGLLVLTLITKKFTENKEPYTHFDLSKELGIEVLILKDILIELEKMKFINEIIFNKNEESRYQIALNPDTIKIKDYIEKFESKNLGYYDDIFDNLKENEIKVLKDIRENIKIENSKLIKDINN